jgi:parallel beta-helix repeat protein
MITNNRTWYLSEGMEFAVVGSGVASEEISPLLIHGNTVERISVSGGALADGNIPEAIVSNNTCDKISVTNCENAIVVNNQVSRLGVSVEDCTNANISNNSIVSNGGRSIYICKSVGAPAASMSVVCSHNNISGTNTSSACILATDANKLVLEGNIINTTACSKAIDLQECGCVVVRGNVITAPNGIEIENSTTAFTGVLINANQMTLSNGIGVHVNATVAGCRGLAISGNSISLAGADVGAGDFPVKITSTGSGVVTGTIISGNYLYRDDDDDDCIHLNGDSAAAIDYVVVTGNHCTNGTYGIGEATDANSTNVVAIANVFNGMGTATFEGTISNALAAADHNAT